MGDNRAPLVAGKRGSSAVYLHVSAVPQSGAEFIRTYERGLKVLREDLNVDGSTAPVLKFHRGTPRLSFIWLDSSFDDEGHPAMRLSVLVDTAAMGVVTQRSFTREHNPPVIHRKELLVASTYPRWVEFASLTASEEKAGVLNNPPKFREQWEAHLRAMGARVIGNKLFCYARATT